PLTDYLVIKSRSITGEVESRTRIEVLVSRAQNGDNGAFTLLYQEYVQPIYRYIYVRVGQAEQAEDLTQDVFLKALDNIGRYRDKGQPFASWLFRIAHNLVIDHYRQVKKNKYIPLTETITVIDDNNLVATLEHDMEISEIKQAIEKLPTQQREVISLRFGSDLSVTETALAIGKTEGTVKKLQHVALSRLRKMMSNE
ncbi:MAG: sigma-70 family RNA polymerase sigma factor, partial [Dehalococcoidales bacterium]|nr:sigma-70 family RNA polymerase sigma factor [Dehalococcoidales bacterium]